MKRFKCMSVFFTAVLVLAVVAAGLVPSAVGTNGGSDLFEELKPLVEVYNQNIVDVPVIASLIGEERIHGEISLNDGGVLVVGITTDKDAKVTSFEKGEISDPTIKANTSENTVRAILASSDPVSAFQDALDTGAITFEGVGLGNKLKVALLKGALKILGFFM